MARTPKIAGDRREQILEAAMVVFSQKGYNRATNKDIAHEAGITPGLIYHYFDNKDAVLRAVIEERSPLRIIRTLSQDALAQSPAVFLHMLVSQILSVVESENFVQLIRVLLPEMAHNPSISSLGTQVFQQELQFLEEYLAQKVSSGELRSTHIQLAAQSFVGCIMGFIVRRHIFRDPVALQFTREQIADAIVTTVLEGLLPR
jgi:AcrR family transcriptional regulator